MADESKLQTIRQSSPRYYVELLGKALDVIDALRKPKGEFRLSDLAEAAHLSKATAFRILYTLQNRGYVFRDVRTKRFRLSLGHRTYRVGYAQLSSDEHFSRAVTDGLIKEAGKWQVELAVADNQRDPEQALKNAARLVKERVDFVIEYQVHYRVAPLLGEIFSKARIPTMAIDIPMPGAVYFGANNYAAGLMGGEALGHLARRKWRSRVDRVLLVEQREAGRIPQSRIVGLLQGIRSVLPHLNERCVVHLPSKGTEAGGYEATARILRSISPRDRILIAAVNDPAALGAVRAVRELGQDRFTAIIGQGFSPDPKVEAEIREDDSPFIGSVAYFPEKYGTKILPAVLRWLNKEQVPPAIYTDHALVTKDNIDQFSLSNARLPGMGAIATKRSEAS